MSLGKLEKFFKQHQVFTSGLDSWQTFIQCEITYLKIFSSLTRMFCFQVVVIKKGTIAEQGTHEELIELDGVYKQLVLRQLERGADDDSDAENKNPESQEDDEDDDDQNGVHGPSIFRQVSSTIM